MIKPISIFAAALTLSCAGCAALHLTAPAKPAPATAQRPRGAVVEHPAKPEERSRSQLELDDGIRSYQNGRYKEAANHLHIALALGLSISTERATAHKYLAFMDCADGHEDACREEFREALFDDPNFELKPAEAGHPIWGPVFRSVKAEIDRERQAR